MKNLKILLFTALIFLGFSVSAKADEYTAPIFNKAAPSNIIELNAIKEPVYKTKSSYENDWERTILDIYLKNFKLNDGYRWNIDFQTPEQCNLSIEKQDAENSRNYTTIETRTVQLKYQSRNEAIANNAQQVVNNIKKVNFNNNLENYILEDLNLINYYLTIPTGSEYNPLTSSIMFVPEVINFTKDYSISIKINVSAKRDPSIGDDETGSSIVYYKGTAYGYGEISSVKLNNVIYIPANTVSTKEAYIEAIKQKLSNSFANKNIEVTYGGDLNTFLNDPNEYTFVDQTQTDGNYYYIKINGKTYPFVVIKKPEEMKLPTYTKTSSETAIQVSTDSLEVPLDATVEASEVGKNTQEYNKIKEVLMTDNFRAFDINLYSETLGKFITKLETGLFKITIPLGTNYIGKSLVAYYIKNDNTLEKHKITLDEYGNATFETNHFSTYVIAEEKTGQTTILEEQNPNTYDGITQYLLLGLFSILLFGGAYMLNKKIN